MSDTIGGWIDKNGRHIEHAVEAACQRKAIVSDVRAQFWLSQGDAAIVAVDQLYGPASGTEVRASRFATTSGEPVSASSDPMLSLNPLLDAMSASKPALVQAARAEDPDVPRLFSDRDLPLVMASGADVGVLRALPWSLRHRAAQARTDAELYEVVESRHDAMKVRAAERDDPENVAYTSAFSRWLSGSGQKTGDVAGVSASSGADYHSTEQLHQELFGPRSGPYGPDGEA